MTSTETRHPATDHSETSCTTSGGDITFPRAIGEADTKELSREGSPAAQAANIGTDPNMSSLPGSPADSADQESSGTHRSAVGRVTVPTVDQASHESQPAFVGGGSSSQRASSQSESNASAPAGAEAGTGQSSSGESNPTRGTLADPFLALAADILDDLEREKIANQNRLRQLTRSVEDSDGETRGFGLDESHPDVARLAALVELIEKAEHQAVLNLQRKMREHPLGPWVKQQKGLGEKQTARLLAAIGDPYWNTLHDRPRTVSELWAYCGFHVLHPGGLEASDNQDRVAAGVAPKRQRGQKSNWNESARKRAWLVANSVVKAGGPYRETYDATKDKYADAVHTSPCVRCGPAGKPAPEESPLSKAHIHARGLRAVSKSVLKDLWVESKRFHELPASGHVTCENHAAPAAGRTPT